MAFPPCLVGMKAVGAFALALALGCGTGSSSTPAGGPDSLSRRPDTEPTAIPVSADAFELTVATYNINFGNGHTAPTIDVIAALDADIILLQETTEASEAAIRARLSDAYEDIRFHHCCRAGGLGVLSRFPIFDAEIIEPDVGFFPAWWLRAQTPAGPLVLVDVHLRPPISDGGSWVVGFFSTQPIRAREIGNLWVDVPKDDPVIVAGDFNEETTGGVVKLLESEGLTDALPQFAPKQPTWHWPVGAVDLRMQLDHVTYGEPLVATDARVIDGGASDHQPVIVTFRWPRATP